MPPPHPNIHIQITTRLHLIDIIHSTIDVIVEVYSEVSITMDIAKKSSPSTQNDLYATQKIGHKTKKASQNVNKKRLVFQEKY